MRVYIAGHYSRNKGNVTLLYVMVSLLEKIPGITELVISSFEPANTRKIYSWPCVEWPFNFRSTTDAKGIHKILEGMWMLLKGSGLALLAILVKMRLMSRKTCYNLSSSLKAIGTSDLLISPGGHMFTNYNHFPGITAHFFPCFLAYHLGVEFMIMSQTIGPFFGRWKYPSVQMTKYLLRRASYVAVRDSNSLETLKELGERPKQLEKSNETVLLFPYERSSDTTDAKKAHDEFRVGFTFHHIYYKRWMSDSDYIERMVKFIDLINQDNLMEIDFIVMDQSAGGKGDKSILELIHAAVKHPDRIRLVDLDMDPREIIRYYDSLDALVATKTHSVVYGLRCAVPTLGIAYERKTEDFMRDFHQSEYCIRLSEFDPYVAARRMSSIIENREEITNVLHARLEVLQAEALKPYRYLEQKLSGLSS